MKQTKRFCCVCTYVCNCHHRQNIKVLRFDFFLAARTRILLFPKNTHLEKQFVANNCPFGQDGSTAIKQNEVIDF